MIQINEETLKRHTASQYNSMDVKNNPMDVGKS
jgi:hypothetical protein